MSTALAILFCFSLNLIGVTSKIYLSETFESKRDFEDKWISSKAKKSDGATYDGVWELSKSYNTTFQDLSLTTQKDAAHYCLTKKLDNVFDFHKSDQFIFQYSFKFPKDFSCGGAYVKLYADIEENHKLEAIFDKSRYSIMFGPDKCGAQSKIHFIFQHLNPITKLYEEKHCSQPTDSSFSHIFTDEKFHSLRLILKSDNSFQIFLDTYSIHSGSLLTSFSPAVNPPKFISDPQDRKPSDWDDRVEIDDPLDKKPDDWDENEPETIVDTAAKVPVGWLIDAPATVSDPDAIQPVDWDTDVDGEWVAPLVPNPACSVGCGPWNAPEIKNPKFKGKWFPRRISNPAYKGEFKPRNIPNPQFFSDEHPYKMSSIYSLGLELWVLNKGIVIDDLFVADSVSESDKFSATTWSIKRPFSIREFINSNMKALSFTAICVVLTLTIFGLRTYFKSLPSDVKDEKPSEKFTKNKVIDGESPHTSVSEDPGDDEDDSLMDDSRISENDTPQKSQSLLTQSPRLRKGKKKSTGIE